MEQRSLAYMPALDGLRAVAVVVVLFGHGWGVEGSQLGVDLFFVLSGFLITMILLEERKATGGIAFRRFYARRARRLLPALSVLLAVYVACTGAWRVAVIGFSYTTNIVLMTDQSSFPVDMRHLWSLAMEEQFYLILPVVLLAALAIVSRRALVMGLVGLAVAATIEAVIVTPGADPARLWAGLDTQASPIVFGCVAALVGARPRGLGASIGALACCGVAVLFHRDGVQPILMPVFAAGAALVVLHLAQSGNRLLGARLPVAIGKRSYGIYLYHLPLFILVGPYLGVVLTTGAACLSWRYIERPILGARRRVRAAPAASGGIAYQASPGAIQSTPWRSAQVKGIDSAA